MNLQREEERYYVSMVSKRIEMSVNSIFVEYFHLLKSGQKIFLRSVSCEHQDLIEKIGVILHPFPFSSEVYSEFYTSAELNEFITDWCSEGDHLRLMFPDLPGFGKTLPGNQPEDLTSFCNIVEELTESKQVILGGCSMGGYIVLECLRSMINVQSIILIDTQPHADSEEKKEGRIRQANKFLSVLRGVPEARKATLGILGPKFPFIVEWEMGLIDNLIYEKDNLELRGKTKRLIDQSTLLGVVNALHAMAGRKDTSNLIKDFDGSTFVLVGEKDTITPPKLAQEMFSLAKHAHLEIIPDVGHLPMLEKPEVFTKKILSAIKKGLENS